MTNDRAVRLAIDCGKERLRADRAERALAHLRDGVQTIATNPLTPTNVREALQRLLADRSDQP